MDEQPGCEDNQSRLQHINRTEGEETHTPPVNQMTISSVATGLVEGKNQKNSSESVEFPIGSNPAYDSPRSKSTSGNEVPLTANAKMWVCVSVTFLGPCLFF
jgi:hypothetical protein